MNGFDVIMLHLLPATLLASFVLGFDYTALLCSFIVKALSKVLTHSRATPAPGKRDPLSLRILNPDICCILVCQLAPGLDVGPGLCMCPVSSATHVSHVSDALTSLLLLSVSDATMDVLGVVTLHTPPLFPDGFVVTRALLDAGCVPVRTDRMCVQLCNQSISHPALLLFRFITV